MCKHCALVGVPKLKSWFSGEFKSDSWHSWERHRAPFDYKYSEIFKKGIKSQLKEGKVNEAFFAVTIPEMYLEVGTHFAKKLFERKGLIVEKLLFANYESEGRTITINEQLADEDIGKEIVIRNGLRRIIRKVDGFVITVEMPIDIKTGDSIQLLKSDFDVFVIVFIKQLVDNYLTTILSRKLLGLNATTTKDIEALKDLAEKLVEQGKTEEEIKKAIDKKIEQTSRNRASTITKTEVSTASNLGGYISASLRQYSRKTWLTQFDDRVRDSHLLMEGQTIPIDEPFQVPPNDLMRFPNDESLGASLANIINCRCAVNYE